MQSPIHWPVGSSLRFTAGIANRHGCEYLVETAVLVLTPPRKSTSVDSSSQAQAIVEQKVYAFAAGMEIWIQTDLLEPIPISMMSAYRSKRWPVQKS